MRRWTALLAAALVAIPAAAWAQVTCTKTTRLVTVSDGSCSSTYSVGTIRCADGTVYDSSPALVSETCGSGFA
jgi:hypothetical protein